MRILDLATYPVARPISGGQLRLRAMARAYGAARIDVRLCAVYDRRHCGTDDIGRWDLPFDPERSSHRADLAPADDLRSGFFAAEDPATFAAIAAMAERYAPDALQLEQPWCWPVAERLLGRWRGKRPKLIYSAHTVEGPLRRRLFAGLQRADSICRLVEDTEAAIVSAADLVLAVTEADADRLRAMGAKTVAVFGQGTDAKPSEPEVLARWKAELGPEPFALFVGSSHPSNATGFMAVLGPALAFLPPDRKIVVVGNVAERLLALDDFQKWEGVNLSRLRLTGPLPETELAALLAIAHVIVLPITAAGGSSVKTAEALHAGRYVVGTSVAFRGFERFLALPGVDCHDDPADFKRRLVERLDQPQPGTGDEALRRELLWPAALAGLAASVQRVIGAGR